MSFALNDDAAIKRKILGGQPDPLQHALGAKLGFGVHVDDTPRVRLDPDGRPLGTAAREEREAAQLAAQQAASQTNEPSTHTDTPGTAQVTSAPRPRNRADLKAMIFAAMQGDITP